MSSKRIIELMNLGLKVWEATSRARDAKSAFGQVVTNLSVNPPIPCDDEELIKIWAQLATLDRHVLRPLERKNEWEFNVMSKMETAWSHKAMLENIEIAKKVKNVAQVTKIVANEIKSVRTPTGFFFRIATGDVPVTSLYAGREPMVDEINRLADSVMKRCEDYCRTRENVVRDTKWILELHNMGS